MKPAKHYTEKAEGILEALDGPDPWSVLHKHANRGAAVQEALAWAQLAHLALTIGPCCGEHA